MRRGQAILFVTALTAACGGNSGSTGSPTSPPVSIVATRADVSVTISPNNPVAQPSGSRDLPWQVDWTVVLRESAGLGGNVNYVNVGFVNSFGFETPGVLNYGADEVIRRAGTNRLNARGELRIPLSMIHRADGFGGRTIQLKSLVNFTDDRGNNVTLGATANVLHHDWTRY